MVIEGMYLRVCSLSFVSVVISGSSAFCCVRVLVFHLGVCVCVCVRAFYYIIVLFGGSMTGAQTCNSRLAL